MEVATFYHVNRSTENIGDASCCPQTYFPEFAVCPILDITDAPAHGASIIGGGGLLTKAYAVRLAQHAAKARSFLWGVGSNVHGASAPVYPVSPTLFTLAGIRDWGSGFNYVPCPSCLSPAFSNETTPVHELVVYEHHAVRIPVLAHVPRMTNKTGSLAEAAKFIATGAIVVTNSYHGAYWAMLLQRKVLLFRPFSSRFFGFKHMPPVCTSYRDLHTAIVRSFVVADYLEECRELNLAFARQVFDRLN